MNYNSDKFCEPVFLKWWLLLVLMIFGSIVCWYFNFHNFICEKDNTTKSFIIIGLFKKNTLSIGYKKYHKNTKKNKKK